MRVCQTYGIDEKSKAARVDEKDNDDRTLGIFQQFFPEDLFFAPAFTGALSAIAQLRPLDTASMPLSHVDPSLPIALRQFFSLQDFPSPLLVST